MSCSYIITYFRFASNLSTGLHLQEDYKFLCCQVLGFTLTVSSNSEVNGKENIEIRCSLWLEYNARMTWTRSAQMSFMLF